MTGEAVYFISGMVTSLTGIATYETFYPNNAPLIYLTGVVVAAIAVPIGNMVHYLLANGNEG